jgi:cation transport ATPase
MRSPIDQVFGVGHQLRWAAGLDRTSEHPLARAVVGGAESRGVRPATVLNFASITGQGVRGESQGHALALGNAALMKSEGVSTDSLSHDLERLRQQGRTVIFLSVDRKLAGAIAVGDPSRRPHRPPCVHSKTTAYGWSCSPEITLQRRALSRPTCPLMR